MPISSIIWDINMKIDNLALDFEAKYNKDENDYKAISHVTKLKNSFEQLVTIIKKCIPKVDQDEFSKIKADLIGLLGILNSDEYNKIKKVVLAEQRSEALVKRYEPIIKDENDMKERILRIKQKKELNHMQDIEDAKERTAKIERIKQNRANRKFNEIEQTREISRKIERIKQEKAQKQLTVQEVEHNVPIKQEKNSIFSRIKARLAAAKTRAQNDKRKSKLPWFVAVPLSGLLAISFVNGKNAGEKFEEQISEKNNYTDSVTPGKENTTEKQQEHTQESTTKTIDYTFENNFKAETSQETTNANIENTAESSTLPNNEIAEKNDKQQPVEDAVIDNTIDESEVEEFKINIGDKIKVEDGLQYAATCYGEGPASYIGAASWRPATEYSIERVAYMYNGQCLGLTNKDTTSINDDLNKYAQKYGIDPNDIDTKVLISLVPGSYDTGWASISIDNMKDNVVKVKSTEKENNAVTQNNIDYER